ncbi:hypothetical protein CHU92_09920 [Flavobacterium cyanobacteriorum]|uniref:SPW repeat-containing integral membrane domain-containing protein n=1 Tax=Flavobacterium cyanobacteriorum TaxID=2022802 RepID=A0A255Z4C0_9FLAO|nr:SPW repeat protein [Flavobacterium cyanobacteriorum]OYQ36328.1 hypothetical protein CHU92_09920 [Flavobacterium cyanobacteriorum]
MRFIDTKTHGFMDYLMGLFLIIAPWIFGLDPEAPEGMILIILGALAVLYSLMTRYELGMIKVLSMKAHLTMDILSGILLAASPWLFGFADRVYLPHLILGLIEIGAGLMTKTTMASATANTDNNFG